MLKEQLVPWINAIFMEDTANLVQEWYNRNMAGFWTKKLWPPSSRDLNPMDFDVWSILESNACSSYHPIVTSFKSKLKHFVTKFHQKQSVPRVIRLLTDCDV